MIRSLTSTLLVSVALLGSAFVESAHAAGLPNWNGFYAGLHGGYVWQDTAGIFDSGGDETNLAGFDRDGGVAGVQVGYNWQSGMWVVGIEGDWSGRVGDSDTIRNDADLGSFEDLSADTSYLASIRARFGVACADFLFFGTAGIGFSEFEFSDVAASGDSGSLKVREEGVVFGGGVEWLIAPQLSLRAEYLHYDVGSGSVIPDSFPDADGGDNVQFDDIDVVRAAINWRLQP